MDLERQKEIAQFVKDNPRVNQREIGSRFGLHQSTVSMIARKYGVRRNGTGGRNQDRDGEIIELLRHGNLTLKAIGLRYKLTRERIRQIAIRHSIARRAWFIDATKVDKAIPLIAQGIPVAHVAVMVDVSVHGLRNHIIARGVYMPQKDDRPWTPAEDHVLKQLYGAHGAARRIADKIGRTRNEVIGRANRLGLCKPLPKDQFAEAYA